MNIFKKKVVAPNPSDDTEADDQRDKKQAPNIVRVIPVPQVKNEQNVRANRAATKRSAKPAEYDDHRRS